MPTIETNCDCVPCQDPIVPNVNNTCAPSDPCVVDTSCPVNLDTDCVYYNKFGQSQSYLTNLGLPNGTSLKLILEQIDESLGFLTAYNFPLYTASCINYDGFVISSMTSFLENVDNEFCSVKTGLGTVENNLNLYIAALTAQMNAINHPGLTDGCGLGFTINDTLSQLIVKLKNGICSLQANLATDLSPTFSPSISSTVSWILGGTKNHTPIANVIKSASANNQLVINSDGLYVGPSAQVAQVLSYNAGLRTISLSGGGGSVILPVDLNNQTLSLNTTTKILSISGGNNVDLTPILTAFSQTAITPNNTNGIQLTATGTSNTNLTATLLISPNVGNSASILSNGLFVPPITGDVLVKASAAGASAGYLIDKINVEGTLPVEVVSVFNVLTDKLDVTISLNDASFYLLMKDKACFNFKIYNSTGVAGTYDYVSCAGVAYAGVAIAGSTTAYINAKSVACSDSTIHIYNYGLV